MNNSPKRPFKERLQSFMYGRYGADELYKFLFYTCLVLIFINIIVHSIVITAIESILLVFAIYRCFSKNFTQRRKENGWYLNAKGKVTGFFKLQKNRFKDRKTHVYRRCPSCRSVLRLPKKKGEHSVVCPKCRNRFDVKI